MSCSRSRSNSLEVSEAALDLAELFLELHRLDQGQVRLLGLDHVLALQGKLARQFDRMLEDATLRSQSLVGRRRRASDRRATSGVCRRACEEHCRRPGEAATVGLAADSCYWGLLRKALAQFSDKETNR